MTPSDVPVFVLCGGLGTRLKEETEFRPKPMVPIGDEPILEHILRLYRKHGYEPVSQERVGERMTLVTLAKGADTGAYAASA